MTGNCLRARSTSRTARVATSPRTTRTRRTLRAAGIERAKGLITTIDSDAHNVYVILSARSLNPNLFVVARANTADSEGRLMQAGASRVVSPYTMAGHRLPPPGRRARGGALFPAAR